MFSLPAKWRRWSIWLLLVICETPIDSVPPSTGSCADAVCAIPCKDAAVIAPAAADAAADFISVRRESSRADNSVISFLLVIGNAASSYRMSTVWQSFVHLRPGEDHTKVFLPPAIEQHPVNRFQ